ncbi:serine/threonine-protein kinase nekl-2-like [Mya arenaria]|uniref:serine/threonine-protein kinase nekl-2-like n=1 Tax=Mya arenaria TaxID=6604 RepID=UPI0022E88746|nr:serine/threonine-protein kinase nekl-2-like [Mya arenaria]
MTTKYRRLCELGSGSFGKAWLVKDVTTGHECVSKEIQIAGLSEKEMGQCVTEVWMLSICKHINIVRYIEAFVADRCLHIVMEYANGGDLGQRISERQKIGHLFRKETVLDWFVQICLALEYIHSKRFLHRDLKPQNVFLTTSGVVKLGDFGIARHLIHEDLASTRIGTPLYISPEICKGKLYDAKSDMWAAGCLLYEMCALHVPFRAANFDALVGKILAVEFAPLPSQFHGMIQTLLSKLLVLDPGDRFSAKQVLDIPELVTMVTKLRKKNTDYRKEVSAYHNIRPRSSSVPGLSTRKNANMLKECALNLERMKMEAGSMNKFDEDNVNVGNGVSNDNVRSKEEDGYDMYKHNRECSDVNGNVSMEQSPKDLNTAACGNSNIQNKCGSRTYTVKDSILRKLSAVSPRLSETVRRQRFSLSVSEALDARKKSESGCFTTKGGNCDSEDEVFSPAPEAPRRQPLDSRTYSVDSSVASSVLIKDSINHSLLTALSLLNHNRDGARNSLMLDLNRFLGNSEAKRVMDNVKRLVVEGGQGLDTLKTVIGKIDLELLPIICLIISI